MSHIEPKSSPVQLVLMPFVSVEHPSIGLSLLKSILVEAGIPTEVQYANLRFMDEVGLDVMALAQRDRFDLSMGDWVFAGAAFPDQSVRWVEPSTLKTRPWMRAIFSERFPEEFREAIFLLREHCNRFIESEAERIVDKRPKIVGCSSVFEQHVASLALLRKIKDLDPEVITLMGGANCEKDMGWATVREFPWVDYVVSGEADEIVAPLCQLILESGSEVPVDKLPRGVLGRQHVLEKSYGKGAAPIPRAVVLNLENLPTPDYAEYFETLSGLERKGEIRPGLIAETSRGCWWGEVSHCTFCGLNGDGMAFRGKSPEKAMAEFTELAERWNIDSLEIVDNIIETGYLKTLLPTLESLGAPFDIFYETKSNLRRDQVRQMAAAGIRWFQPGIEALHDSLLDLMGKGSTTMINVQLLKYAREYGIRAAWSFLIGFPMEDDQWHSDVADWLPRLEHLQPPGSCLAIRYDRFSPYFMSSEDYGLELVPYETRSTIYPVDEDALADLSYFFENRNTDGHVADRPGARKLIDVSTEWTKRFFGEIRPILSMVEKQDMIEIFDSRPCSTARRVELTGLEAAIYRACEPARAESKVAEAVYKATGVMPNDSEVALALESLDERFLILRVHGKVLSLAIEGSIPVLPKPSEFPGGWVRRPPATRNTMMRALGHLHELEARG
ncbi:RiPP maturation radical SAM C-methyltransferase [Myxococcota bacterium]|nr:RiPP maturation radical SAM C-methyltransferase [Myxococcota bacterium]